MDFLERTLYITGRIISALFGTVSAICALLSICEGLEPIPHLLVFLGIFIALSLTIAGLALSELAYNSAARRLHVKEK